RRCRHQDPAVRGFPEEGGRGGPRPQARADGGIGPGRAEGERNRAGEYHPANRYDERADHRGKGGARRCAAHRGGRPLAGDRREDPRKAGDVRAVLLLLGVLAAPGVAAAAQEAGGRAGIPWWGVFQEAVTFSTLAGVLFFFLRKPVSAYLKDRSDLLRKSIDEAARARADAAEKLAAIEVRVAMLPGEIAGLNRKMDAEADEETRRLRKSAQAEIARLRAQVQSTADQEVKKARAELRREAAELSARAAEEIVAKTITPGDQERMVRENIDRI